MIKLKLVKLLVITASIPVKADGNIRTEIFGHKIRNGPDNLYAVNDLIEAYSSVDKNSLEKSLENTKNVPNLQDLIDLAVSASSEIICPENDPLYNCCRSILELNKPKNTQEKLKLVDLSGTTRQPGLSLGDFVSDGMLSQCKRENYNYRLVLDKCAMYDFVPLWDRKIDVFDDFRVKNRVCTSFEPEIRCFRRFSGQKSSTYLFRTAKSMFSMILPLLHIYQGPPGTANSKLKASYHTKSTIAYQILVTLNL